eukprot:Pgem_evm1s4033
MMLSIEIGGLDYEYATSTVNTILNAVAQKHWTEQQFEDMVLGILKAKLVQRNL